MAARIFYDKDCDISRLNGKTVAIIGYGSQGHAHALNLKESGVNVLVGLYKGSKSWAKAEAQGMTVMTSAEAAAKADIIMILINDELQAQLYRAQPDRRQDIDVRPWFQHSFRMHQTSQGCQCSHGRSQGSRSYRTFRVSGRPRRSHVDRS